VGDSPAICSVPVHVPRRPTDVEPSQDVCVEGEGEGEGGGNCGEGGSAGTAGGAAGGGVCAACGAEGFGSSLGEEQAAEKKQRDSGRRRRGRWLMRADRSHERSGDNP
jgi:hypothetical protein